jgi:hypothetical protein
MKFREWLQYGFDNEFCSDISCSTHDLIYLTEEETIELMNGEDPCIFVVRVQEYE